MTLLLFRRSAFFSGFPLVWWWYLYLVCTFSFLAIDDLLLRSNLFSRSFLFLLLHLFLTFFHFTYFSSNFSILEVAVAITIWATSAPLKSPFSTALFNFELMSFSNSSDVTSFPWMSDSFFKSSFSLSSRDFGLLSFSSPFLFLVFSFQLSPTPVVSAVSFFLLVPV